MFLTKVGLLQKERKRNDAWLSAPSPGTGAGAALGAEAAAGPCPAGELDPPCHLWWPSLLVLVLVDSPDGSLDVLHAHEALVQAEVVADGILRAEQQRAQRHGPRPHPPPHPPPPHPPPPAPRVPTAPAELSVSPAQRPRCCQRSCIPAAPSRFGS